MADRNEARPSFRLLDLPPELWARICTLAVVSRGPILINPEDRNEDFHFLFTGDALGSCAHLQPAITCVCRVIRVECLKSFYSENLFYAFLSGSYHSYRTSLAKQWLQMNEPYLSHVRRLYLDWSENNTRWAEFKQFLEGVRLSHRVAMEGGGLSHRVAMAKGTAVMDDDDKHDVEELCRAGWKLGRWTLKRAWPEKRQPL